MHKAGASVTMLPPLGSAAFSRPCFSGREYSFQTNSSPEISGIYVFTICSMADFIVACAAATSGPSKRSFTIFSAVSAMNLTENPPSLVKELISAIRSFTLFSKASPPFRRLWFQYIVFVPGMQEVEAARSAPLFPSQRAGGAPAPYKRFAGGKTLADCARRRVSERNRRSAAALGAEMAEFISAEHFDSPRNPKGKDTLCSVSFPFGAGNEARTRFPPSREWLLPFAGALAHLGLDRASGAGWRQRVR